MDGKKYLSNNSLYPNDPIEGEELKKVAVKSGLGAVLLILILIIMQLFDALNITNIINLITVIAVLIPVYYFVMMLGSKKTTKAERSRIFAYIPLFWPQFSFGQLKNKDRSFWHYLQTNKLV